MTQTMYAHVNKWIKNKMNKWNGDKNGWNGKKNWK
jgi:hypothetical protein